MCVLIPDVFQVKDKEHQLYMYCHTHNRDRYSLSYTKTKRVFTFYLYCTVVRAKWGQIVLAFSSFVTMRNILFASILRNFSKTLTVLLLKITPL